MTLLKKVQNFNYLHSNYYKYQINVVKRFQTNSIDVFKNPKQDPMVRNQRAFVFLLPVLVFVRII